MYITIILTFPDCKKYLNIVYKYLTLPYSSHLTYPTLPYLQMTPTPNQYTTATAPPLLTPSPPFTTTRTT